MLFSIFFFTLAAFVCGVPTSLRATLADDLVSSITVTMTLDSLVTNLATACKAYPSMFLMVAVSNSRLVEITLDRVAMSAGVNGTEYLSFDHTFEDPVVVPILGTADSGDIADVQLTQGGLNTVVSLSSASSLDLLNLDVDMRVATIGGKLGIPSNETGLTESNVPATFDTPFNKEA
ncbi:hypothetical protein IW261DRAFT_1425954 [Armillaria novae-zelandiae]|uniref:Uncharacterized protein n=1 Tax=Armillaria novae-zelandiae TaxID=153914 RepID=A0AA39T7W5_9AGAR|nr:hypothetical protein IW261DRAFT_1425954 [Armillaria novae-zelandiae]